MAATLTDHIEDAATHPELFWETSNHQSLCDDCNKRKAIELEGGLGRGG
jgi:5-methylcytosine-specific restriction endonuclease McrA